MTNIDLEYENTVKFLFSQLPMFQRDGASAYKKDLTNTIKLCQFLGNPEHQFKSVHVAGTNGKGSSSHYLAAIMQKAGYKTGLYTSPHLKSFTERIKINGVEINKEAVVEFVDLIKPLIKEIKPSFFEITVAMCFHYFAKEQVDIAIIEVGMGGRLDSTNVIIPEVSLITNISNDHQQWLGNDIATIAGEKAGIIKEHIPTVISERQPEIESVFVERAKQLNSHLYFAEDYVQVRTNEGLVINTDNMEV
ncbi:MAG: Mur ligase family protein, partial [Fulvivirga sp.]